MRRSIILTVVLLASASVYADQEKLIIKKNDVWVMAGDSITAQKLHTNYLEAFFRIRYPELNLKFRNSGVGGNRACDVLRRFDYDIASFKPTIVSIELGMNDVWNGDRPDQYIRELRELISRIRQIGARPILISSSPVNDGSLLGKWNSVQCKRIHTYTEALKKLGQEEEVLVIDQYHPLIGIWGRNRSAEEMYFLIQKYDVLTRNPDLPGIDSLKEFKREWTKANIKPVLLGGDPVHPGAVGQYMMAAIILDALNVKTMVSYAEISGNGAVVSQDKCKITNCARTATGVVFSRVDDSMPWPTSSAMLEAENLVSLIGELSDYGLKVTGLPEGQYSILMNGVEVTRASSEDLSRGINLGLLSEGPISERGAKVLKLVGDLQNRAVRTFRVAQKEGNAAKARNAELWIRKIEQELNAVTKPQVISWEVRRISE